MIERDKMSEKEIRDWYVSKHGLEANDDGTKDYFVHKAFLKAWDEQRPHGKWEFVGDNLFKCTHCGYIANGDYLRDWKSHTYDAEFPTACPKCGADMSANDRQVTGKLNSEIEKSKSEVCPCIECCKLDNSEPCRKGCSDYQKWKEGVKRC